MLMLFAYCLLEMFWFSIAIIIAHNWTIKPLSEDDFMRHVFAALALIAWLLGCMVILEIHFPG